MHRGGVQAARRSASTTYGRAAARELHQPHDLGEQRAFPDRGDLELQRRVEFRVPANTRSPGPAVAGTVSPVIRLVSSADVPSSTVPSTPIRSPAATRRSSRRDRGRRNRTAPAVGSSTVTARVPRARRRSAAARVPAGAPVEIAPDQQEEQQHDRGVEVDVRAAAAVSNRLMPLASRTPSEIGTSMLVRRLRSARARIEERPAGVQDRRQRDQRREPVQQVPRRRSHVLEVAGPDRPTTA